MMVFDKSTRFPRMGLSCRGSICTPYTFCSLKNTLIHQFFKHNYFLRPFLLHFLEFGPLDFSSTQIFRFEFSFLMTSRLASFLYPPSMRSISSSFLADEVVLKTRVSPVDCTDVVFPDLLQHLLPNLVADQLITKISSILLISGLRVGGNDPSPPPLWPRPQKQHKLRKKMT